MIALEDSCVPGSNRFRPRDSCPESLEQGANDFCDLLVEGGNMEAIGSVKVSETVCGGRVLAVEYGWAAESFYFDSTDTLVAYTWGTDTGGGQCAGVVPCQASEGTTITWCDELHGDLRGEAGAGGQGGAPNLRGVKQKSAGGTW
jgi:hypothetical protein